jgi:lycopene cyclase domain-containing protein
MPLYLLLLIFSIIIPLILSFDKKVSFYKYWKSLFPAVLVTGSVYIIADIYFVKEGIWGFNPAYHSKFIFLGLPLEEWLFFIFIPYACIFIHFVFLCYFPNLILSNTLVRIIAGFMIVVLLIIVILNWDKTYTVFNFSLLILALVLALFDKLRVLNTYFLSFLLMLIPFFIINAILTGTIIPGEVVWYNNSKILGIRLLTIPVEDIGYAFSLILLNLLIMNRIQDPVNLKNQIWVRR